jgi:hypothetical protein
MRAQTVFFQLPRHPLLRTLVVACGAVLAAGLVAMGLVVGLAVLAIGATTLLARRWLARRRHDRGDPTIIEGEFSVVSRRSRNPLPHYD